jgi:hypothetical protein
MPPPVYRPLPTASQQTARSVASNRSGAPPVYRPSAPASQLKPTAAPPVYRPVPTAPQPKTASSATPAGSGAPPVYRPQPAAQQRRTLGPTVVSPAPLVPQSRGANAIDKQHSAHLQRVAQAKMATARPQGVAQCSGANNPLSVRNASFPNASLRPGAQAREFQMAPRNEAALGSREQPAAARTSVATPTNARTMTAIQRVTALVYTPSAHILPQYTVTSISHDRVAHGGTQAQIAAQKSGWLPSNLDFPPGNCKHYVGYARVQAAVEQHLVGMTVQQAITWLTTRTMKGAGQYWSDVEQQWNPLGAQPVPDIQNQGTLAHPWFDHTHIAGELEDFIANLANDPRNLYYRASSSGDGGGWLIDEPTGTGRRTLADEKKGYPNEDGGLHGYRAFLQGLGLAV